MTPLQIGQSIRLRRKQLRLSQERLANLASCSKPFIIAAEAGKPTLRLDKLLEVLNVIGFTLELGQVNPRQSAHETERQVDVADRV